MEAGLLGRRDRLALAVQHAVGRLLSPVWVPATVVVMRWGLGWRIVDAARIRREYRQLWQSHDGPLIVCANHLTLIDSAVIAWALGSWVWFLAYYAALPWNVPEQRNFTASLGSRLLVYLMKCVPVVRGGDRAAVAGVLGRLTHLLRRGEAVLLFPEGGRSRTGRVDVDNATYGVGQLIAALPGCRVLCVYLRGEGQHEFSDLPARGERFHVRLASLEPVSGLQGMRAARDLSQQVMHALAGLEREHFAEHLWSSPMLGNDVVDLADAAGHHPRFAARVFTASEQALIDADPGLCGVLWAAKESAYKAARKADRATVFSPSCFVVDVDGAQRATVTSGERRFVVDLVRTVDYVHAVARAAEDPPIAACAAVETVPAGTSDGDAVRRLALDTLARALGIGGLEIGRDGRIPLLLRHGQPMAADLSLSHHGRFAAFACVLR